MNKDQKPQKPLPKSEMEVLKQFHQFVRDDDEDIDPKLSTNDDYGRMIARKYYDKLYKEYAIIDLSQYKTGKIGMRWRTEPEVLSGKGETICGNKVCTKDKELSTWELNFKYKENQEIKNTLVKVKCCIDLAQKIQQSVRITKIYKFILQRYSNITFNYNTKQRINQKQKYFDKKSKWILKVVVFIKYWKNYVVQLKKNIILLYILKFEIYVQQIIIMQALQQLQ